MILDIDRFITEERPYWDELEGLLAPLDARAGFKMDLTQTRRFYYLYRRAASDLARIDVFVAEPSTRVYLEDLVGRAYAEIHETRDKPYRIRPKTWLLETLPRTFRRRCGAFYAAVAITLAGVLFGGGAVLLDPEAKAVLMPFSHLEDAPSERVAKEEQREKDRLEGAKSTFAAYLMTHNIRVSIMAMAMGLAWGFGTVVLLFYNGAVLGAVFLDYIQAGESVFLAGWLLPHGAIEIPAILVAGQAGLVLGRAMIGWGNSANLRERLRQVGPDVVTLIFGAALMLVWAGIIEAFFSQYHEPTIPYALKIAFGAVELICLTLFLSRSGRQGAEVPRHG